MTTTQETSLNDVQALVTNALDLERLRGRRVAAIFGDVPSTYAKSPKLWNAAFEALSLEAVFIPLDVSQGRLGEVLQALRPNEAFLGGSVTVPYKTEIIPLLDDVDPLTKRIGAVNVVVRTADGKLIGYNTDGLGGLRALTDEVLTGSPPLLTDLTSARVLLIGAGGAAQAVAFNLWERMTQGELVIANRARASAEALVGRLTEMRAGHLVAIPEAELPSRAGSVDLIVNATVKGQAGIRKLSDGQWTILEPYSALGSAAPFARTPVPNESEAAFREDWFRRSAGDIQRNQQTSLEVFAKLPKEILCYDIIYAPLETMFLRHARWSGHRTANGRAMNVVQAVEAFCRYVCHDWLAQRGEDTPEVYQRVAQAMVEEWAR